MWAFYLSQWPLGSHSSYVDIFSTAERLAGIFPTHGNNIAAEVGNKMRETLSAIHAWTSRARTLRVSSKSCESALYGLEVDTPSTFHLLGEVIRNSDILNTLQLGFKEVNVSFLVLDHVLE